MCDELLCVDGGIQSFLQCVNCLLDGKKVTFLHGLRNEIGNQYFSCGEFFYLICCSNEIQSYEQIRDQYFKEKKLFDENKPDADTKLALFNEAWQKFEQLLEKNSGSIESIRKLCEFV